MIRGSRRVVHHRGTEEGVLFFSMYSVLSVVKCGPSKTEGFTTENAESTETREEEFSVPLCLCGERRSLITDVPHRR
jgi:hypothetical protein